MNTKILLIYTGGTIGMVQDTETGSLIPLNFKHLTDQVPELKRFTCQLDSYEFEKPIDSSNVNPDFWASLVQVIEKNYEKYDGFVILHGTDTMAHTASALSFMIQNIDKPIILTGSQLPIGMIRTDGKDNLITSIEVATDKENGESIIKEVCVCFENKLYRGNRIRKVNAEYFRAFTSENYPCLADIGIGIHYRRNAFLEQKSTPVVFNRKIGKQVAILKFYPGISKDYIDAVGKTKNLKALIIETYGSGNIPTFNWVNQSLQDIINQGIIIINITQCIGGAVNQGHYETSSKLVKMGVYSGQDITIEAGVTKLMYLLGQGLEGRELGDAFTRPISGEMTIKTTNESNLQI